VQNGHSFKNKNGIVMVSGYIAIGNEIKISLMFFAALFTGDKI
jgi:hypothetical protein